MSGHFSPTVPDAVYAQRMQDARLACQRHELSGAVVGPGAQFAYFTGSWASSHERLTALVLPAHGEPTIVAPQTDIASLRVPGVSVTGWQDGEDPYALVRDALEPGTVGIGAELTADHVFRLQALLDDTVEATSALAEVFMVKDEHEIEQLAFAGHAIDRVHARVPELLQPGKTEREVAAELEKLILEEHDAVDFIIVGSGPNGANPHHDFSDRVLAHGDSVVVDIGGTVGAGYHSDCTRTYQVGEITDPEYLRAYDVLRTAQQAALDAVRPGVKAGDVDAAARDIITQAGFGQWFTHRLGHGIGLAVHEEPYLVRGSRTVLREGMTFSIEPGIYKPGEWGMRIEDIVVVSSQGTDKFNFQPKELL